MSPDFRSTLTGDHDRSDFAIEVRSLLDKGIKGRLREQWERYRRATAPTNTGPAIDRVFDFPAPGLSAT
jgi:hypothetical protein